jgi:hypothetical protein
MADAYTQGYNNGLVTGMSMGLTVGEKIPAEMPMLSGWGSDPVISSLFVTHYAKNLRLELGFVGSALQPNTAPPVPMPAGLPLDLMFSRPTTTGTTGYNENKSLPLTLEFSDPGGVE